ncbi:Crp/Fnr family transcriptional regulator [Spirillospora sp. NPDC127200]
MAVSAEAWKRLLSSGSARRHPPGAVLLHQGAPAAHVLILVAGRVKVLHTSPDGDVLVLAIRGPGEILGDISVLGGDTRSATVVALDECETRVIPADRFRQLVHTAGLEAQLLRHAMERIREGEAWRAELAALPAGTRLVRALTRFAEAGRDDSGAALGPVDIGLGQAELGQATGLARSTVAAELAKLRDLGLIATAHRRIVILDPRGLRALAPPDRPSV